MSANQATLDFIDQYDENNGKDWSNSKEGVAEFAEAFAREHQQLDGICESEDYEALIETQAKLMRMVMKKYELAGFTHDEAFQLVHAAAANGQFQTRGG